MRTLESRREMFIGSIYNKLRDTGGDSKKPVRVFDRAATDPLKDPRASLSTCSLKAIRATVKNFLPPNYFNTRYLPSPGKRKII